MYFNDIDARVNFIRCSGDLQKVQRGLRKLCHHLDCHEPQGCPVRHDGYTTAIICNDNLSFQTAIAWELALEISRVTHLAYTYITDNVIEEAVRILDAVNTMVVRALRTHEASPAVIDRDRQGGMLYYTEKISTICDDLFDLCEESRSIKFRVENGGSLYDHEIKGDEKQAEPGDL